LTGNYQTPGGMTTIDSSINQGVVSDHYYTETTVPWGSQKQVAGVTSASFIVDNLYIDEDRHFDCVFIDNNNPIGRFPDSDKLVSQLKKINLVIALDSFNTISTQTADYILPTPTFLESYEISAVENNLARLSEPVIVSDSPTAERIYETLLERLDLIDNENIKELIEKYHNNKLQFFEILLDKFKNKEPVVYYVLYRTVGIRYKNPIVSLIWWKIFTVANEINPIEKALELADTAGNDIDTKGWAQLDFPVNVDRGPIDLTGKFLLRSLYALNSNLTDANYKFVLQCGYRQKDSMNGMIPNTNLPLVEVNSDDLRALSIDDGEEVSLQTESAELQIKCRAIDNLQSGLIRIANHAIINKLSNTKNRDYLNPQYKLVFANIRKTHGIS
jgi:anaerobic selenocysteine-containing dehydrogenase